VPEEAIQLTVSVVLVGEFTARPLGVAGAVVPEA
jgi:hypothetical protein